MTRTHLRAAETGTKQDSPPVSGIKMSVFSGATGKPRFQFTTYGTPAVREHNAQQAVTEVAFILDGA